MKKSRWVKCIVIILLAGLAVFAVIVIKNQIFAPPVQETQAVIEGDVVADSEEADITDGRKEREQEQKEQEEEQGAISDGTGQDSSDTGQHTEEPVQAEQVTPGANQTGMQEIQARLENLVNSEYHAGGGVAVCTGRVNEGDMAMVNGGPMQAASLIKLYVAGCVYENYGSVSAQESYSGETESLLSVMITVSDNTACNTLVTRLGEGDAQQGMARVNQYCANHGFSDTHMGRLMLQPNDVDDNYTSVRDCCTYLKMASAGQLEGASSVLGYMNQQQRRSKIPAGVPAGVTVGNKTGELSNVENDAAIIYGGSGTYVLCVMSENLADTYSAQQFIARTSGVVYEAMQ